MAANPQSAIRNRMTPEHWKQIEDVFYAALEREPGQRAAFLDHVCAGDSSLRAEVEGLIASFERAETFIEAAIKDAVEEFSGDDAETMVGRRIGPYQVIREIGRGGMGAVYLAARADEQYQKRVAIKLVKPGMDSEEILRRFRHERQILASLDHPNIARLYDGGTTEDGLPYFVMEHIEGIPIDEYGDQHKLSTVERLKLFQTVCSAVQYAHRNLVVHRDIKPSNILVTAEGAPKLLDFGIAKVLNPELSSQATEATAMAQRPMTLEYASPEQIRGEPITTASDVYSLGVVLYELLTGQRPYRVKSRLPHEIIQAVCEEEPEKPSTAISRQGPGTRDQGPAGTEQQQRTTDDGQRARDKLARQLAGDLDNIVLMALRKEPQRRYASVEQFSEDIRRYLEGRPIIARKDTLSYRTGKFAKRHKVGVMAAAVIVLTLLGGIVATAWQARLARAERSRAERRFNDVRKLANSFLFEFHDAIQDLPGSTPARELVVKRALEYLDSLAKEAGGDPSLQRELAAAYQRVGDVQGLPAFANLGDVDGARESYRKALAIFETLSKADPANVQLRRDRATTYDRLGDVLKTVGDTTGALQSYQHGLAIREALSSPESTNAQARRGLATSYQRISDLLARTGNAVEALERQRQALTLFEALSVADSTNTLARYELALSLIKMGDRLGATGDRTGALEHCRNALAIFEALVATDSKNLRYRRGLASNHDRIGNLLAAMDDTAGALEHYRQSLAMFEVLAAADPKNAELQRDLSIGHEKVGSMLAARKEYAEALQRYRQALAISEALAAADPENAQARYDVSYGHETIGDLLIETGDLAGALERYRQVLIIRESLSVADPKNAEIRSDLAKTYKNLGKVYTMLASQSKRSVSQRIKHWHQARSWYQNSLDVLLDMRQRGILSSADAGEPDNVAREIARCDAALAK
jgi:non-specific serine/threonine protein kinase/serine/threonine-protein kinase